MIYKLHESKPDIYMTAENAEDHFILGALVAQVPKDTKHLRENADKNFTLRLPLRDLLLLAVDKK